MSPRKEDLVVHLRPGQVGQQHAESDGHQQQRFKLLHDAQVQQYTGNQDHNQAFPVPTLGELVKARTVDKIQDCFHTVLQSVTG